MEAHNIIILSIVIVEDINDMKKFFLIFRDYEIGSLSNIEYTWYD